MKIPPAERLAIYEKMLPYFEGEERIMIHGTPCYGFCRVVQIVSDWQGLRDMPELMKRKPRRSDGLFWFTIEDEGPDINRTNILKQAIEEVKQLL